MNSLGTREKPLVTCICPTQNRRIFLRQAVEYFLSQEGDIPAELVIVDASPCEPNISLRFQEECGIRYYHEPNLFNRAGAAHNRACELALGNLIIQWDDDDWQSPDRMIQQVKALHSTGGESTLALTSHYYGYHLAERKAFRSRSWGAGMGSLGSAFAFHRSTWEAVPFADVSIGSDQIFFEAVQKARIRILDMQNPNYFVYIRHNQNVSPHSNDLFEVEATLRVRHIMADDVIFYDELSEILPLAQWNHPRTFGQHGVYPITKGGTFPRR